MTDFVFRLQALLDRRTEERKRAEEELSRRERALLDEQKTMREMEAVVEELAARHRQKRVERSQAGKSRAVPILVQDQALLGVKIQVEEARSAVLSQQMLVDQAMERVREGRSVVAERRREEDVLEKYRQKAQSRFEQEERQKEEMELDEIGSVMFLSRREQR